MNNVSKLEIKKTFGLGSRIRDMALWDEQTNELVKCELTIVFLPPIPLRGQK